MFGNGVTIGSVINGTLKIQNRHVSIHKAPEAAIEKSSKVDHSYAMRAIAIVIELVRGRAIRPIRLLLI